MKRVSFLPLGALLFAAMVSGFGCGSSPSSGGGGAGGTGAGVGGSGSTNHASGHTSSHSASSGTGGGGGAGTGGGGGSGTGGGGGATTGTGGGTPCTTPVDCPDPGNECIVATCTTGVCDTQPAPLHTPLATQVPGNCKKEVCDGAGATTTDVDDTDKPVDNDDCTDDICTNGSPSNPNSSATTSCGTPGSGLKCDGAGKCVGCTAPSDCGTSTVCAPKTCNSGTCGSAAATDGTACDDGNACTQTDSCVSGACVGKNPVVCGAPDPCHTAGTCNTSTGVCSNPAKPDGAGCNDGDACTQTDKCQSGVCTGTSPVVCPGPDQCHTQGTCDATTGACSNPPKQNGASCNDGNLCTQGDSCQGGVCSGSPVVCTAQDQCHSPGTCDVATGTCSNPAKADGASCNDNDACTQTDTCQSGACVGGNAVVCPNPDQCHTQGTCDSTSGTCDNPAKTDGVSCNDGNGCTSGETCQSGACTGGTPVICTASDGCHDVGTCDSTSGSCSNPAKGDGTACTVGASAGQCFTGVCEVAPSIVSMTPADGGSALANTKISVTFDQAMDAATLTGQTTAGPCTGTIQVSLDDFATCIAFSSATAALSGGGTVATLTPAPGLLVNTTYAIRVTTGAENPFGEAIAATFTQPTGFTTTSPNICDNSVVISQIYGSGGTAGATWNEDFIELHNRGSVPVDVSTWSVQYAASAGTSWNVTPLVGSIPAGGFYLIAERKPAGGTGANLPAADATDTIDLSGSAGKVVLLNVATMLPSGASGVSCPTGPTVVDFIGYGGAANCFEGPAAAPAPNATTSLQRIAGACSDTNQNNVDFATLSPPNPRNHTTVAVCGCTVEDESNVALEADYCSTQSPLTLSVSAGANTGNILGQVYELGTTEANGPNPNVRAQLGFGPLSSNPEYAPNWTWVTAAYDVQAGSNDQYKASFVAPPAGTYGYVYRFSLDSGVSWTVCDINDGASGGDAGSGSNPNKTFQLSTLGILTVN